MTNERVRKALKRLKYMGLVAQEKNPSTKRRRAKNKLARQTRREQRRRAG